MRYTIILILFLLLTSCNSEKENPRKLNGKLIWGTPDSVYYITFKIDSVVEAEMVDPEDKRP